MRLVHFPFNDSLYRRVQRQCDACVIKTCSKSEALNSVNTTDMINFVNNVRIANIVDRDAMKY